MQNKFIVLNDKGIVATGMKASEVMSLLLYAYLDMWNDECGKIDIIESADKIMEFLGSQNKDNEDDEKHSTSLDDALKYLFSDDKNG